MTDRGMPRPAGARRAPRRVTPDYLERSALHYLERFATSSANLRRILMSKVERSARTHGTDREEGAGWVEALIERFRRSGLLDDRLYAEAKAASLHRRGTSTRRIREKLAVKGVGRDEAEAALAAVDADAEGDPDLAAAASYARRRRIGPYRRERREENRDRDLAALARAGFSYEVARRVADARDAAALEEGTEDGP